MKDQDSAARRARLEELQRQADAEDAAEVALRKERDEEEQLHLMETLGVHYQRTHVVVDLSTESDLPGRVVLRGFSPIEYRQFQGFQRSKDPDSFFRSTVDRHVVWPPRERWTQVMDRHPGAYQDPIKRLIERAHAEAKKS